MIVIKVVAGIVVYVVVVLLAARFCATNTICEEREQAARGGK